MELSFTKTSANLYNAQGQSGKLYDLIMAPLEKTFVVKYDNKVIKTGIKGYGPACTVAQDHENSLYPVKAGKGKSVSAEATLAPVKANPVKASPVKANPVKADSEPETLQIDSVFVPPKKNRNEDPEDYKKRIWGAKMQFSKTIKALERAAEAEAEAAEAEAEAAKAAQAERKRLRAVKASGINVTPPVEDAPPAKPGRGRPAKAAPVEDAPAPARISNGKRGLAAGKESWNDWDAPTPFDYAMAQLTNARASRDYSVVHSGLHKYSEVARLSYLSAIERCFVAESRLYDMTQDGDGVLPKGFTFEYFNAPGVPANLVGFAPEGDDVMAGHVIAGFGKNRVGAGVRLPVVLSSRKK